MKEISGDFVSITWLVKYLNFSKMKIYSLMKNDKLPYYRLGRRYYFKLTEIDEFINGKKLQ
jgi:excisionase family DNA binding protein